MIGRVKKALGIEGVKIKLHVSTDHAKESRRINGELELTSLSDATVSYVEIRMMERYSRGRKDDRLVNDYVIGRIILDDPVSISKGESIRLPFTLPYIVGRSDMDKLERDNFILGGLASIAKWLKKVKSSYRIVAEAKVKGTKLHPHDEVEVRLLGR